MDWTGFRPLTDGILVKLDPEPQQSVILAPAVAQERSRVGVVVAVGPGKLNMKTGKRLPMGVTIGDRVRFSLNDFEDDEHTLIKQGDILGVLHAN